MRRLVIATLLAVALVAGLVAYAAAQVEPLKHHACYGAGARPDKAFTYLPNGADPCPFGWTKIDWIDD
jgi:hypothetical protein